MKDRKRDKNKTTTDILHEAIVEATQLSVDIERALSRLESLKDKIRSIVVPTIPLGETTVKVDTNLGPCHVTKVKDALVLSPGYDADVLKLTMPDDVWNTLFVMRPTIRNTADAAWRRMSDVQKARLGDPSPLEFVPRRAQVKLPK